MEVIKMIALVVIGFSGGVGVAGGVFAFIAIIGVVPRIAQKSGTVKYLKWYEDAIMLGGIFGALSIVVEMRFLGLGVIGVIFGLSSGIFIGSMAVSLAEVLDVIPILCRRVSLKVGISYLLLFLSIGKLVGALIYFLVPGFAHYK